jgi:hypothetical protein
MPKFITIGYGDRDGYDRTDATVRDAAHAHDARLRKAGILWVLLAPLCRCEIPTRRISKQRLALSCPVRCL